MPIARAPLHRGLVGLLPFFSLLGRRKDEAFLRLECPE
jgi:hypothetical protein